MNDAVDYAREVYAACKTVGYESDQLHKLKRLLDEADIEVSDYKVSVIIALAQHVQAASVAWVESKRVA